MPKSNDIKMKKCKLILFIIGTFFTIVGFLLVNTENYPFVLKIVAPSYVKGITGIKTLESFKDLKPGMVGFREIAIPLSKRLIVKKKPKNHPTNEKPPECVISIIKYTRKIERIYSTSGVRTEREVKAECEDGNLVDTTMEVLQKNVDKLKVQNLKWYSFVIFFIGLVFNFISFFVERKEQG